MPKAAKRNITVATSSDKPVNTKASKRNVAVAAAKPEPKAAKPVTNKPAPAPKAAKPESDAAVMPRGLTRDAAGIVRYATNYALYSDRDSAYLAFFGAVCRQHNGAATLRQIHDAGITRSGQNDRKRFNPNYSGSGKATDVGAINRLCKAGYFTRSPDGNTITATAHALSSAIYRGSKAS